MNPVRGRTAGAVVCSPASSTGRVRVRAIVVLCAHTLPQERRLLVAFVALTVAVAVAVAVVFVSCTLE